MDLPLHSNALHPKSPGAPLDLLQSPSLQYVGRRCTHRLCCLCVVAALQQQLTALSITRPQMPQDLAVFVAWCVDFCGFAGGGGWGQKLRLGFDAAL